MPITLEECFDYSTGATELVSVDFTPYLDSDELIDAVVSVSEVTTSAITIANQVVNTETFEYCGNTAKVGGAVQFTVNCSTEGMYRVRVTANTDSSPVRTPVVDILLRFI